MAILSPVQRKSLKTGLITENAVAHSDYPMDACYESINFNFDCIGRATLRKGSTQLGNSLASSEILGLYEFRDSGAGTNNQLVAVNGSVLYYLSAGTWTSKRGSLTTGSKANFTTFLDYLFMVNGTEDTAIWSGATGDSFVTTGNASGAPIGKYIDNYRSRVWIAGNTTFPDRIYYSSIPSAVGTPIITWDTDNTTGQWIDISPSDGENITALHRTRGSLLAFKQNHIYQVYSIGSVDSDPKINVGTWSDKSIVETKGGVFFHHPTGFYLYQGGNVQEISQPIIDIVKGITLTNYSKVSGWLETDGNHVCWAIGNVGSYTNLVVRYTISSGVWTQYSYPYQFVTRSTYNDGSVLYEVVGDTNGKIYKIDTGLKDNTTPIFYSLIHSLDDVDNSELTTKTIDRLAFIHKGGNGGSVNYRDSETITNDWTKKVCQLGMYDTSIKSSGIKGRKIQFKISGTSIGEPFSYEGYEILSGNSELI